MKQPPGQVPLALAHEEKEAIDNLKKQGVIRESSSPWASPIILVRKKNGKIRPCVDYRRVNFFTRKDAYPIPRTQGCLDAMAGSVIFSTLDMSSGYHQIPIKEEDISKTAFVTKQGLYEFTTMQFGLTNAPATFQWVMEIAGRGLQWSRCLIYLDDVLIFGRTTDEHATRLKLMLERIHKAGLKLKPEKCELFQTEVRFLGHVVSAEGVQPDPTNTSKIRDWLVPKSVTEVRPLLGLCSYYRKFVKKLIYCGKTPQWPHMQGIKSCLVYTVSRSFWWAQGQVTWNRGHRFSPGWCSIHPGHRRLWYRDKSCALPGTERPRTSCRICQQDFESCRTQLLHHGLGVAGCSILHGVFSAVPIK